MASPSTLTVINLDGGVQFLIMAPIASHSLPRPNPPGRAFDHVPDCAIFNDNHWEPPTVCAHSNGRKVAIQQLDGLCWQGTCRV